MVANGKVDRIKIFLFEVLEILEKRSLSTQLEAQASSFKDELFGKFVAFQRPRVKSYWKLLQPEIRKSSREFLVPLFLTKVLVGVCLDFFIEALAFRL